MYKTLSAVAVAVVTAISLGSANAGDLRERAKQHFQLVPDTIPAINGNVATPEKIALGRMLFFEPRLSASGAISCNSCHNLALSGGDYQPTPLGHGWSRNARNTPTVLNAVLNSTLLWDGSADNLKEQAKRPVQARMKMNSSQERVEAVLNSMPEYVERFAKAFPDAAQPVSFDNVANAIEAFETTLLTPNSRFDRWLAGDDHALNAQETQGLALFLDKDCVKCHEGVNLGGEDHHPFGVVERLGADLLPPDDKGRFAVTKTATDEYVFRASPLRNVALTAPFFHSGQVWDLKQAVAIMGAFQVGVALSNQDEEDITAFLETLTGIQPQVEQPILPPCWGRSATPHTSITCRLRQWPSESSSRSSSSRSLRVISSLL